MTRPNSLRLAAVCALAVGLLLSSVSVALARRVLVDLRVVAKQEKVIAETSKVTGTASIPTSPRANCFGKGTGGSGKKLKVTGPTALGLLAQASNSVKSLNPLLLTDAFDFGLGICGIGGYSATKTTSWYLKVNHTNPERSNKFTYTKGSVRLREGDEVLWALVGLPYPKELFLTAPKEATPGAPFEVKVFAYDDFGKRKPAKGARVTGGAGPTDSKGRTTVTLLAPTKLRATHGKDIPSNGATVCIATICP
jgi:hypothetical protein